MRVCGRERHFWRLTVNRMNFCTPAFHSKHSYLAIFEARGMDPTMVAPCPVVDRWKYIINGLSVIVNIMGDP